MIACTKKKAEPTPTPDPAGPGGTLESAESNPSTGQPKGPTGIIEGTVTLKGDAPEMPVLQRGADPACNKVTALAETVVLGEASGLANVLIRIKPGTVPPWTPPKPVVVDQVDCMYRPRVQGGVRGQKVEVMSSDTTIHNVHARYLKLDERQDTETLINLAQPPGVDVSFELGDEPIAKLVCDHHAWMQGFILVSDNPYSIATDENGKFKLEHVPAGEQKVEIWHELYGLKEAKLTVEADESITFDFAYDAVEDNPRKAEDKP